MYYFWNTFQGSDYSPLVTHLCTRNNTIFAFKNIDIEVDIDEIRLGGGPASLLVFFFVFFASKRHSVAFPKDNVIRFSCIGAFD